jgi:hypothetical protein
MTRFAEKLDALRDTAALLSGYDLGPLAAAIAATRGRRTIAVGSGGSTVAATFFARCRETLLGEPTVIVSPLEMVVGVGDLVGTCVWIFSAGADNPDTVAAVIAAHARGADRVDLLTRNPSGAAVAALNADDVLHSVPVADPKDGFLATHSLVSTIGALLVASDLACPDGVGTGLVPVWIGAVAQATSQGARAAHVEALNGLNANHLIILAADTSAATLATLMETSLWEAALCAVQRTDLRNLAHGRHTWLQHRPGASRLFGLVGVDTRCIWSRIIALVPESISVTKVDLGDCGRFRNAVATIDGLGIVEGVGVAVGIDPGRPGIGQFGRSLYADTSLLELANALSKPLRQKRDAVVQRGDPARTEDDLIAADAERRAVICAKPIGAVVMDYDGTIVATDERFSPPRADVLDQLVRLHSADVVIAIATGRGGSAGEALRLVLPASMHEDVIMGYYNGGHVVQLSVDIAAVPPPPVPAIAAIAALLTSHPLVPAECSWRDSGIQLTIPTAALADAGALVDALSRCPEVADGQVRITRSAHSVDLIPSTATKLAVVEAARRRLAADEEVITIGDSGARGENDCELLSREHGISIGSVCGRHDGSHSLLDRGIDGPQALVKVLSAMVVGDDMRIRFDIEKLVIDTSSK